MVPRGGDCASTSVAKVLVAEASVSLRRGVADGPADNVVEGSGCTEVSFCKEFPTCSSGGPEFPSFGETFSFGFFAGFAPDFVLEVLLRFR